MRLLAKCLFLQYEFTNSLVNIDNISCFDNNKKLYVLPLNVLRHIVLHVCEVFVYIATCTPHIFKLGIFPRFLQMHFKCTWSHDYDFEWLKDLMIVELGMSMNCLPFRSTWVHSRFFGVVCVSPSLVLFFLCCRSLFLFFVWPLCCLSIDLRLLVIPLLSSTFCTVFATRA